MREATVTLVKQALCRPTDEHLTELPRWVRPNDGAKYWHIPRTARVVDNGYRGIRMISVEFWCGVGRWILSSDCTEKAPSENICGTCEGRARGFEGDGGLVFRPRSDFDLPRLCPATGTGRVCAICGGKERWRRSYCHYDEVQHTPGPLLASFDPCPRHGWKYAGLKDGALVCRTRDRIHWHDGCGYVFVASPYKQEDRP